uniref:Nose resistant-to-fluoxetine protein N-terminal domain-containing protein n=1 Tax=Bracon brevicornis TaxID=1563983 RepID=A0A6V7LTA7_9HYME
MHVSVLDSSSKISSGILIGNLKDLGQYDECVSVKVTVDEEIIRGRHCMYSLSVKAANATISPTLSICLPAACDENDVVEIVQNAIDTVTNYYDVKLKLRSVRCSSIDDLPWEMADIIAV